MTRTAASAGIAPVDGIQGRATVEIATGGPNGFAERLGRIDGVDDEFLYGVSPAWQDHYGVGPDEFSPHATTNDIFVLSLAACLLAVYAGALRTRGIEVEKGDLVSEVNYDIGPVPGKTIEWIIRTIDIRYRLRLHGDTERATATRVISFYETGCPLSQTLKGSRCKVTSTVEFV